MNIDWYRGLSDDELLQMNVVERKLYFRVVDSSMSNQTVLNLIRKNHLMNQDTFNVIDVEWIFNTLNKSIIRHYLKSIECNNYYCNAYKLKHICNIKPHHILMRLIMEMELQNDEDFRYMLKDDSEDLFDVNINIDMYHHYIIHQITSVLIHTHEVRLSESSRLFLDKHFYRILQSHVKITDEMEIEELSALMHVYGVVRDDGVDLIAYFSIHDKAGIIGYIEILNPVIKLMCLCFQRIIDPQVQLIPDQSQNLTNIPVSIQTQSLSIKLIDSLIKSIRINRFMNISNDELKALKNISWQVENEYNRIFEFPDFVRRGCVYEKIPTTQIHNKLINVMCPFLWLSYEIFDTNDNGYDDEFKKCEIPHWAIPNKPKPIRDFHDVELYYN